MKRKIVKQGKATMTVSLPSKWIKNNNINNADEVDIEEIENNNKAICPSVNYNKILLEIAV